MVSRDQVSEQWDSFVKAYPKQLHQIDRLEKRLGYVFKNKTLLYEAMTHRSSVSECQLKFARSKNKSFKKIRWNERIEFLGDSILGLVVSSRLWNNPHASDEGKLSKIRAGLVSENSLAALARVLELQDCLFLGNGEEKSGGRQRDALLADSLEALFGAIYLDSGVEEATRIIQDLYDPIFAKGVEVYLLSDFKTRLQELAQEKFRVTPVYKVVDEYGPDHGKVFVVECRIGDKVVGVGKGHSKKKSSQEAAENAFESLNKGNVSHG